ncbi:hypothetical protein K435DRAFT_974509 [Dendrothele bispora CBS 962.96]|uniref:F-box domain-containing protein n=1 Tax=Dendrothele bispora (strain CBS 962.96) TaxID=1314807 RepID=A0A4V4HAP6_DENBC|nr:hypothetical protein K435DRAFT_974509 [Dendrothele bispora CBS 962.96]
MVRKSARLQSKRKAEVQLDPHTGATEPPQKRIKSAGSEVQSSDDSEDEDEQVDESSGDEFSSSSRKKTRVSGGTKKKVAKPIPVDERFKKVRGRLGFLHKLAAEMPLDVIFEIFEHLEPLDILRLSRTSRDLRNLLTARSSEHVWRNARLNVEELPPLPTDLNEMQYAKLMFDTTCQICGTHCYSVYWDCRVRCCKRCARKTLLSHRVLCEKLPPATQLDIWKFIDYVPRDCPNGGAMREVLLPSAFQAVSDDYQQSVKVFNDKGERVDDEEKLAAWQLSMGTKRTEHRLYTCLCKEWSDLQRDNREDELQELRDQRRGQIRDRLIKSGWGPELEDLRLKGRSVDLWNNKIIKQNKLLTDRIWNQIAPTLFELLQPIRDKRLKIERSNALRSRYEALKERYDNYIFQQNLRKSGYPLFGDVIDSESHVGHDIIFNTPYDQTLPEDAFDEEFKKLPKFIDDWKRHKAQELLEILQKDNPEATVETLGLAKTIFACRHCGDLIWYSEVFQHRCDSHQQSAKQGHVPSSLEIHHGSNLYNQLGHTWNKDPSIAQVIFSKEQSIRLSFIMQSCGLDPETATREDLDSLDDAILECKSCYRPENGRRTFMRWSAALLHTTRDKYFFPGHFPTHVEPSERLQQTIRDLEKPEGMLRWTIKLFTCNHCPEILAGKQEYDYHDLGSHLLHEHGIEEEQISKKDWSWGPRASFSDKAPGHVTLQWPVDESNNTSTVMTVPKIDIQLMDSTSPWLTDDLELGWPATYTY